MANQFKDFFSNLPDEIGSITAISKKGDKATDFPIGYYIYSWHRFKFFKYVSLATFLMTIIIKMILMKVELKVKQKMDHLTNLC